MNSVVHFVSNPTVIELKVKILYVICFAFSFQLKIFHNIKEFPLAVDKTQAVLSFTTDTVSVAGSILKLFNTFSLHKCTNLL